MSQKWSAPMLGCRKVFVTLIVAVMAIYIVADNSNADYEHSPEVYTFSTPANIKVEATSTWNGTSASMWRGIIDDGYGNSDNHTDEWEVGKFVEAMEEEYERENVLHQNTAVNDIYAEPTNTIVRMRDFVGPTNSTDPCTMEIIATATFDISAEYGGKYTFTYFFEDVPDEDTIDRSYTVPEGYKITSVTGFEDNTLSNGGRTISSKPIDDITFVFEKVDDDSGDNDDGLGISAPSLITVIITVAVITLRRRY